MTGKLKLARGMSISTTILSLIYLFTIVYFIVLSFHYADTIMSGVGQFGDKINDVDRDSVVAGYVILGYMAGTFAGNLFGIALYLLGMLLIIPAVTMAVQTMCGFVFLHKNKKYNQTVGVTSQYKYLKADCVVKIVFSVIYIVMFVVMMISERMFIPLFIPFLILLLISGTEIFLIT